MKFAYADPPYLGCGKHYLKFHADALIWDEPNTHKKLVDRLCCEYPDGWAMSLLSQHLHTILPMCPSDVNIGAWCKTFHQIRPGDPQKTWEPVIYRGGRKEKRNQYCRDWLACLPGRNEFIGSKPRKFAFWLFDLIGARRGDTLDDLFPGAYGISSAWAEWIGEQFPLPELPLEAAANR